MNDACQTSERMLAELGFYLTDSPHCKRLIFRNSVYIMDVVLVLYIFPYTTNSQQVQFMNRVGKYCCERISCTCCFQTSFAEDASLQLLTLNCLFYCNLIRTRPELLAHRYIRWLPHTGRLRLTFASANRIVAYQIVQFKPGRTSI